MLKLERLEMSGFKSFVDPVEVRFAGGITGIVGPNGCGKSNLADAISWVLGEQSAKTIRAGTMEDVIFNGSEKRKPLGMGEVTLSFQAEPGFAGSDDGRVTLSRRVFRSGESQYRLNGRLTRLKDFKDLLMDTGLGVRAYSVIEQGKIGLILSGKPQERRRLIEEAAGITRYKARRKIAEVKLEEATANLLRLDDILSEIERNLRSLKRQAGAARRFQERKVQLDELERRVLLGRWAALSAELGARRQELGEAQSRASEDDAAVHRAEAGLAALRERVETLAQTLGSSNRRQAELAARIEGRQQYLVGARRTAAEIETRLGSGSQVADRLEQEIAAHAEALSQLGDRRASLAGEHDEAARRVEQDGAGLREVERVAAESEARLEQLRRELLESVARLDDLRGRMHREQIETEKESYRRRHLLEDLEQHERELGEIAGALAATREETERQAGEVESRSSELAAARQRLEGLLASEAETTETRQRLERELTATAERRRFLAELAEAEADQVRALAERLAEIGLPSAERLGDLIRALPGWEKSLDRYLGALVDAVLVPEHRDRLELATRLAGSGRAGATFLAHVAAREATAGVEDPAVVSSLGSALGLPREVAASLPPAFLVASAADADRLARRHPGIDFVAPDRIWARGGLLHVAAEEAQPGLLERSVELAALAEELPLLERRLAEIRGRLSDVVARRSRTAEEIRRMESGVSELRQGLAVTRTRGEELGARHERVRRAVEGLRGERAEIEGQLAGRAQTRRVAGDELARLEGVHAEREQEFERVRPEGEELRRDREERRALGAGRRGQLEVLTERLRSVEQEAARHERAVATARQQLDAWSEEAAGLVARRDELAEGSARAEEELREALELRERGEHEVREQEGVLDGERQRVREAEAGLVDLRERQDASRQQVEEIRVLLAGLDHDSTHLRAEFRQRCHDELPEEAGAPLANLAELEVDLERLRQQVESFGPVNVLAAEEYGAEEERHKFLSEQRSDVVRSIESLRETIREINETSTVRFRETFTAVNEQFARTFVELFRGGEAEMRLMDEEDVLECGIEIVARPPGKRLQNLMLLSGGEKALTAIALLFALFRIKPSPFCILDEVDAPLDDVNTLRFVGMLRELARETQCIVITHNKLTMEVAATLYGVTMEERGVSKMVAVELEEVHPEARTA
ncbi:MAG TPA: chromosome segregation protein SMC [Thermoanaerobaculia bacterium]|nr:chromosome segregation protein SMC [Thermoanaerobaculia bacterium]